MLVAGITFLPFPGMENNYKKLQEQKAPLKNNYDAFVQVGRDGEPVMPLNDENRNESSKEDDRTTTLDKR